MKYIALLRGINVGGKRKVEMAKLVDLFMSMGFKNVETYLNTGNVFFYSNIELEAVKSMVIKSLEEEFGFEIPTLIKSQEEINTIAQAIPSEWKNDAEYKTDIAYLFPSIDYNETVDLLPIKREYLEIKYVKGALMWRIKRENYNKSHLNKIVGQKIYQQMTIRNVNTARYIADKMKVLSEC